jgi:hypothetical protein
LNRLIEEVWIIFNIQTNSNEFGSLNYGIDLDYSLEKCQGLLFLFGPKLASPISTGPATPAGGP